MSYRNVTVYVKGTYLVKGDDVTFHKIVRLDINRHVSKFVPHLIPKVQ